MLKIDVSSEIELESETSSIMCTALVSVLETSLSVYHQVGVENSNHDYSFQSMLYKRRNPVGKHVRNMVE